MTNHIIRVSLGRDGKLCIRTRGNPHVFTAPGTIRLKLVGNRLARGKFEPRKPEHDVGFIWVSDTARARFGEPVVIADRMVDIANEHVGAETRGCWVYQVRVRVGSRVFETPYSRTTCTDPGDGPDCDDDPDCDGDEDCCRHKRWRVKNNPVIINR